MAEKETDLPGQLKELLEAVNQSSEHTKRQIETIDSNLYIGAIVSLVLTLGITYTLKIFVYWIPAGFILLYLLALNGSGSAKQTFEPKKAEKILEQYKTVEPSQLMHGVYWLVKNVSHLAHALALIYGISFFVLLAIHNGWIVTNAKFDILVPLIACLIYAPIPFALNSIIVFFRDKKHETGLEFISNINLKFGKRGFGVIMLLAKLLFLGIYLIAMVVLPLYALYLSLSLIDDWLFLVLVLILQIFIAILFASYFSAVSAKKELANCLTNFADINYLINELILKGGPKKEDVENLKIMYLTAKPFDLMVDDTPVFVNYYILTVHRVYIKEIPEVDKALQKLKKG